METVTQVLHRLTSYEPGLEWDEALDDPRIVQDFETNDLDRLPLFFKRYASDMPRIELSRRLVPTTAGTVVVLAGTAAVTPTEVDVDHLARILFLCAGVVRTAQRHYGTFLYRAAGSAGGRFPLELYVAAPEGSGLPAGVHWYHPLDHALVRIGPAPGAGPPSIVVTGVPWRTGWRYRERGYRHVYWDAGTMLAQLLAAADSAGIAARMHTVFPDDAVRRLVGADGVHEWPVAVVALGEGEPALESSGTSAAGDVDTAPLEFPLVTAAQRAGERDSFGPAWERGEPVAVADEGAGSVEEVVLARGSQRRMDPTKGLTRAVFSTCMTVAMRGISVPHRVVVHDVEGLAPGVYRWPELSAPVRPGAFREELYRVCLEQGLAADASFVVIGAAEVARLDDRVYREAQLAAGLVEGRLHLLAYALGASASGMTFLDSEIRALLGEPLDGLLFTCLGMPEYKSARGGLPGAPTVVRPVRPRLG